MAGHSSAPASGPTGPSPMPMMLGATRAGSGAALPRLSARARNKRAMILHRQAADGRDA